MLILLQAEAPLLQPGGNLGCSVGLGRYGEDDAGVSPVAVTPHHIFLTSIILSALLSVSAASLAARGRCACGLQEENHFHLWGQEKPSAAGSAQGSAAGVREWPQLLALPQIGEKRWLLPHSAGIAMTHH